MFRSLRYWVGLCSLGLLATVASAQVRQGTLPLNTELAFEKLQYTGWSGGADEGKVQALRPIVLTHFGDGSNRVVVAMQRGVVHVFDNQQSAATKNCK